MPENVQVLHARWIIPVEPAGAVLDDHAVVIAGTRITALLPGAKARHEHPDADHVELPQHALIPGLVNAHTHAAMSLFRGLADDVPLERWLEDHVWPAERRFVDREFVREGTRLAAAEFLRGGTTCFNDMYFFPDEAAAAAAAAGIRAVVGMLVIGFPSAWAATPQEYLANGQRVHDAFRDHPLIRTAFAPHSAYAVEESTLTRIAMLAEELDVPIQMHVHETAAEVAESLARHGLRPLARLQRLGLVNERLLAVHMTQLDDGEIELVARAGVSVVHCPESNMKLAAGFCPVAKLATAGANIALGTDGAASNNDLDMLAELRTTALLAKAVAGDPCAAPAADVLRMATLNGAKALRLEHEIGSLEPGKQADVVAVDLGDVRSQPVYTPLAQLVYTGHRDQITDVWVAGRRVVENRRLTSLDEAELVKSAQRWRARIQGGGRSD
ncbi:MAG: TRZ/ATZ family hydrolase [Gammaproteobacteria bacterium]|nr:TRZ/ATZ family hydrolase [Gammaproteobacteria bacterium]